MITENCGRDRKLFRGFMYRGAVIDIGKDHVMMFDQKVNIQTTLTGDYWVNIMRNDKENTDDENVILI